MLISKAMRKTTLIFIVLSAILFGCGPESGNEVEDRTTLTVFAAASLADAFMSLTSQYEKSNPEVKIILNFAGSQQLAHQLSQGAPADVFASANERQMQAAIGSERIEQGREQRFARNELVIVYPPGNPAGLKQIADLAQEELKLVLATPEVPAGQYALAFLDKAARDSTFGQSFRQEVLANVVSYEENVRAVLSKVQLGEADAAIVYVTDLISICERTNDTIPSACPGHIPIPQRLNSRAQYLIAPVSDGQAPSGAQSFIDYVMSTEGQMILGEFGFLPGEVNE